MHIRFFPLKTISGMFHSEAVFIFSLVSITFKMTKRYLDWKTSDLFSAFKYGSENSIFILLFLYNEIFHSKNCFYWLDNRNSKAMKEFFNLDLNVVKFINSMDILYCILR